MSKLINQQAITRLSQGLHQKTKDLVEAEKNRALAEEGRIEAKVEQNISDIAAINNVETGILKQAKDYVDAAIENVDAGALEDRIEAVETKNVEQDEEITKKVAKADVINGLEETLEGKVLDARQGKVLKDLVDGEVTRAVEAEGVLSGRLDVIEGVGEGSIKKALQDAKSYTDQEVAKIEQNSSELEERVNEAISTAKEEAIETANTHTDAEISRIEKAYKDADTVIDGRLVALEGATADLEEIRQNIETNATAIAQEVSDRASAIESVTSLIEDEVLRATNAETQLGSRIDGVKSDVNKAVETCKTYTDEKVSEINANAEALEERVKANEDALALVDGKIATAKSEAINTSNAHTTSEIAKIDAAYKAADVQVLSDAKAHAESKVGEAKVELERAISTVDAKVDTLQGEVTTLEGRVSVNESDIQNLKDAVSNKNNNTIVVNTEDEIAVENPNPKVGDLAYVISSKRAYIFKGVNAISAKSVPQGWVVFDEITNELDLVDYLKKTDAESTYRKLSEKITEGDLESGLATKINDKADAATLESEIASAKSFATSEAQKEAGIVDGKLTSVKAELQGNIDTVDGKAEANKSAIAILNGDASTTGSVDKKIKDALASYSDTDAVKSILTNVVGSLALSIVEDQVVLSAGGVDGVEISKTSLDMITDAEIDNILSGLN